MYKKYETEQYLNQNNEEEIKNILIGHKVQVIGDNILLLDDGTILEIEANEGCGGCSNGRYDITDLNEVDNAITNVSLVVNKLENNPEKDEYYEDGKSYKIFVFCEMKAIKILQVDGDDGNGYYGTGYEIIVKRPVDERKTINREIEKLNEKEKKYIKLKEETEKAILDNKEKIKDLKKKLEEL